MTKSTSAPLRLIGTSNSRPVISACLFGGKIEAVFESVRLNAEMIAVAKAIGRRLEHPVGVAADEIQQLAAHHGDFRGVDAIRAEDGAAAAFGALVEVVEPLLDHIFGEFARAGQLAKNAALSA